MAFGRVEKHEHVGLLGIANVKMLSKVPVQGMWTVSLLQVRLRLSSISIRGLQLRIVVSSRMFCFEDRRLPVVLGRADASMYNQQDEIPSQRVTLQAVHSIHNQGNNQLQVQGKIVCIHSSLNLADVHPADASLNMYFSTSNHETPTAMQERKKNEIRRARCSDDFWECRNECDATRKEM
jgi:hypothetical protein